MNKARLRKVKKTYKTMNTFEHCRDVRQWGVLHLMLGIKFKTSAWRWRGIFYTNNEEGC